MLKYILKNKLIKPSRLIFLIVLIAANTFAWFIYATKVDSNVSVHVKAWNVVFEAGENEVTSEVSINLDSVYPGMEDYEYNISAYNNSEVSATLSYVILQAKILGTTYITEEGRAARGEEVLSTDLSSDDLEDVLAEDFPFSITLSLSNTVINLGNGKEDFYLNVEWPYESNQDDVDTEWGINAYNYKVANPSEPSIFMIIKLIITQNPS